MFYISNKYLLNIFILSIIYAPNLSEQQTPNPNVIPREPDYCLQQRTNVFDENHGECGEEYSHLNTNNFCSQIECEPIIDCNSMDNENKVVMENITGRGCCPACVTYLEEFADCEVGSVLDRCRNGLFCNPSTKQCNTPGLDPSKDKCLIEYHNRIHGSSKQLRFYIESSKGETKYFAIKYRKDLGDMPGCDDETGQYQLKQCKQEKCYCVNPLDGKFTFGLSLLEDASNVTCKCADHFYQTYSTIPSKACRRDADTGKCLCHKSPDSNACADEVDQLNLERFAQISPKCSGTGNFEPLQCINGTCFCVDEATGRPTPDKAALYGALQTLPCFDLEKAKKVNTKESDANYLNPCEKQLRRPEALSLEFKKKGTELKNMKEVVCSPDGKYALKQCTDTVCMCVKPDTAGLADNYRLDLAKATDMECMCALQGYLSKQGTSYNNLACDPSGNFQAYQCSSEGRKCNCVDPYGAAISEEVDTVCLARFIKESTENLNPILICQAMRETMTQKAMTDDTYYTYRHDPDWRLFDQGKPDALSIVDYCTTTL